MTTLLERLGYRKSSAGKTGGSRYRLVHEVAPIIALHRPHPGNIVKAYVMKEVLEILERENLLN